MAQVGQQQRKDLELVFSLQSHCKSSFKNYGDIVGVYDVPSITMQWESFKSYLLKNSGIMFDNIIPPSSTPPTTNSPLPNPPQLTDDIQIRYVNTIGLEQPINNQDDFQYALYSFRERARIGEINHLRLTRIKSNAYDNVTVIDNSADSVLRTRNFSGGDGLEIGPLDDEKPPEWFGKYMKKFKQEIILEITKVNTAQISSNLKKMQAANHVTCPKRRQSKGEHYKRRPKMAYIATENTSCDNTDVNTITPTLTNPQPFTLTPPKLLLGIQSRIKRESTPPQTKLDSSTSHKQIKLKAKRLTRASSDSDTLTATKAPLKCPNESALNYRTLKTNQTAAKLHISTHCADTQYANTTLTVDHTTPSVEHNLKHAEHNYSAAKAEESLNSNASELNQTQEGVDVVRLYRATVVEEDQCWCVGDTQRVDTYVKKWRIRNTGHKNFDAMTTLRFTWGSLYPIIPWMECPFLQPNESGWLTVCVKIPDRVGSYECHCRLYQGSERFGPWLGFRLNVTVPFGDHSDIVSRVRITSLCPTQQQHYTTTTTALLHNATNQKTVSRRGDTVTADAVDDVVAVIQGRVVRGDGVETSADVLGRGKGGLVVGEDAERLCKKNDEISTYEPDESFIITTGHNIRYNIENQQTNKPLHTHTDSDNDEEDTDDDDDDDLLNADDDDTNISKDLVIVDKHHLQDNTDSDNVSIVSIADSNLSVHSVAATNVSFSSASDEFVVIPMPKRSSFTVSDGDDNSCPELEPDPEFCGRVGGEGDEVARCGKIGSLIAHAQTSPTPQINHIKPHTTKANAVAIASLNQQQKDTQEALNVQQIVEFERGIFDDGIGTVLRKETGFEVGFSRSDAVVIDIDDGAQMSDDLQTCPVDLSTNNTSKDVNVSYSSVELARNKSQIFVENKQQCAATLCDLCINTIMKNKLDNAKKRLFVFPADSPGFEVFTPSNNCLNPKEHQKSTLNTEEDKTPQHNNSFTYVQNVQKADVIIQKQNSDFPSGIWTVQNNHSSSINTQNTCANKSPQSHSIPKNQISPSSSYFTTTKLSNNTDFINETNIHSTAVLKDPQMGGKIDLNDCDSSSSSDSVFLCPSCHCDGECSKLQSKHDNKIATADEIRAQMRQLFVQLAELETPQGACVDSQIASAHVDNVRGGLVLEPEQPVVSTNVELSDSSVDDSFRDYLNTRRGNKDGNESSMRTKVRKYLASAGVGRFGQAGNNFSFRRFSNSNDPCGKSFPFRRNDPRDKQTLQSPVNTNLINDTTPVNDFCSDNTSGQTDCLLEIQNNSEEINSGNASSSANGKLIDAPTPEGSFIEGATAPVENDSHVTAKTAEEESIAQSMEQHRLIQLHCKHDTALADNMNVLYEMGFRNFFGNLALLKQHENNVVLVLEQLLPRF